MKYPFKYEILQQCFVIITAKAGAPGSPTVDKVGKNSVDLSWTKPRNDGGSKIKGKIKYLDFYHCERNHVSQHKRDNLRFQLMLKYFEFYLYILYIYFIRIYCQKEEEGISRLGACDRLPREWD